MAAPPDPEAAERVRQLQTEAAAQYTATQSPQTQAAARNQLAEARTHGNETAGS